MSHNRSWGTDTSIGGLKWCGVACRARNVMLGGRHAHGAGMCMGHALHKGHKGVTDKVGSCANGQTGVGGRADGWTRGGGRV